MKTILITVLDDEDNTSRSNKWEVTHSDDDGKVRTEIGVWLGQFIGKYRYKASQWIKSEKPE